MGCGLLSGDVATFGELPLLWSLDLRKCSSINGGLGSLGPTLRVLCLEGTAVEGTVDDLARSCPALVKLRLSGMGALVTGSLASLGAQCLLLEELHLSDTHVTGKLGNLSSLTALQSLVLNGLEDRLSGDLEGLADLTQLREVKLNGTQVKGDLASLSHLECLTELRLHATYVHGEPFGALVSLTKLTVVTLSRDDFGGDGSTEMDLLRTSLPDSNILLL